MPRRIAVVGAGYAGLALTALLRQRPSFQGETSRKADKDWHKHCDSIVLFESKAEQIPIWGTIRLPTARHLLKKLGKTADEDTIFRSSDPDLVDRQQFQKLLWEQGIQRPSILIRQGCAIVAIEQRTHNDDGNISRQSWLVDKKGQEHGPFDLVLWTAGLAFGDNRRLSRHADGVLGDARWQHQTTLWDILGQTRIQQGGDQALQDALELADYLLQENSSSHWQHHPLVPVRFRPPQSLFWSRTQYVSDTKESQTVPQTLQIEITNRLEDNYGKLLVASLLVAILCKILPTLEKI